MKRNRAERFEATRVMSEGVGCVNCSSHNIPPSQNKGIGVVGKISSEVFPNITDSRKLTDLDNKGFAYKEDSSSNNLKSFTEALGGLLKEQGVSTQKDAYAIVDKLGEQYGFSKEQIAAVKEELDKAKRQERPQVSSVPVSSNRENISLAAA